MQALHNNHILGVSHIL